MWEREEKGWAGGDGRDIWSRHRDSGRRGGGRECKTSEERRNELFEIVNAHQSWGQKSPADV